MVWFGEMPDGDTEAEPGLACDRAQATEAARPVSGLGCVTLSSHLTAGPLCPRPHQEWTTQSTRVSRGSWRPHGCTPTTLGCRPQCPAQTSPQPPARPQAPACPLHQARVPTLIWASAGLCRSGKATSSLSRSLRSTSSRSSLRWSAAGPWSPAPGLAFPAAGFCSSSWGRGRPELRTRSQPRPGELGPAPLPPRPAPHLLGLELALPLLSPRPARPAAAPPRGPLGLGLVQAASRQLLAPLIQAVQLLQQGACCLACRD